MAKDKIMRSLEKKGPNALREGVHPVDILSGITEQVNHTQEPTEEQAQEQGVKKESEKGDRKSRTEKRQRQVGQTKGTRKPRVYTDQSVRTVLAVSKRDTKRYSFEIYKDQEADLDRLCNLYRETTGDYLSASRVIREVLDTFLPDALKAFEKDEE